MEGKIAAQRTRLVAKTGMNTLRFKSILWAFYEHIVDIQCCWTIDVLGGNLGMLVEKFEVNLLKCT